MFTCNSCGHEEMVHQMFVGCCLVASCPCLGVDGRGPFCTPLLHAAEHNSFTVRTDPASEFERLERHYRRDVSAEERERIIALKREGHGSRVICGLVNVPRPLVREVIIAEFGKGPATLPRTRPRQEDRERALAAGITAEQFQAERVEGGRSWTIAALDEWIAERIPTQ